MKIKPSFFALVLAMSLGACSHYSDDLASLDNAMKTKGTQMAAANTAPQDIAPAAGGENMGGNVPSMGDLNGHLAREYYTLARFENDQAFDYKAAKTYTKKAMIASKGSIVVPSKVSSFDLEPARAAELTKARGELIAALKEQVLPENQQALAKAQVSFDCWLERAEEADTDEHFAQCKNEFESSMASLTMPAAGVEGSMAEATAMFGVAFMPNTATLETSSWNAIDAVAQFLKDPQNAGYAANMTGFTAATSPSEFSNGLVNQRLTVVRDALVAKGVDVTRLKPFMAQASAQNAKVEITFVSPSTM